MDDERERCVDRRMVDQYLEDWKRGSEPDLKSYLTRFPDLPLTVVGSLVRIDMIQKWRQGERNPVEYYLTLLGEFKLDTESLLDLIFMEFLLRENEDQCVALEFFVGRFPFLANQIRAQIEFHRILSEEG